MYVRVCLFVHVYACVRVLYETLNTKLKRLLRRDRADVKGQVHLLKRCARVVHNKFMRVRVLCENLSTNQLEKTTLL